MQLWPTYPTVFQIRNPYFISLARTLVSARPAADVASRDRHSVSVQAGYCSFCHCTNWGKTRNDGGTDERREGWPLDNHLRARLGWTVFWREEELSLTFLSKGIRVQSKCWKVKVQEFSVVFMWQEERICLCLYAGYDSNVPEAGYEKSRFSELSLF